MGNLLGENFPEFVKKQVETRQEVYGRRSRSPQDLEYLNNKSSWIKLGSAVDIDPESKKYKDLGIPEGFGGEKLAKALVLFNGSSSGGNNNFKGIARDGSIINTSTYGFGGLDFGLVPMPGIKSVSTKYKNRGSLREATINLVAYNRKQFEIIEILYLRLGYTLLLEYGYDKYLNKDQELVDQGSSLMGKFLNRKYTTFYEVLDDIRETRANKDGNYDGFVGKVKNFNWTFNKDGSYDITIVLVSMGDIIESLNVNVLKNPPSDTEKNDVEEVETTQELVESVKNTNEFASIFNQKIKELNTSIGARGQLKSGFIKNDKGRVTYVSYYYKSIDRLYYIRFDELLKTLQDNIVFTVGKNNTQKPSLTFDTDIEKNLMCVRPRTFSTDPRICSVDNSFEIKDSEVPRLTGKTIYFNDFHLEQETSDFSTFTFKEKFDKGEAIYGRIMNMFIEMGFILKVIKENIDDEGKLSILDFLNPICSGINESLSNVCDLEPVIDEELNIVRIIENKPLPYKDELLKKLGLEKEPTVFEVYGYNPTTKEAGFVKDFGFKTEISNALATTITIGAQANGTVKGEDATAFSAWNEGLTDSISLEKNDPGATTQTSTTSSAEVDLDRLNELKQQRRELIKDYHQSLLLYGNIKQHDPFQKDASDKTIDNIKSFSKSIRNLNDLIGNLQESSDKKDTKEPKSSTPQIGFIPLNLSLTMDGLTGFKIYQQFFVNQRVLPPNYPQHLYFLIKGITHKVDSSGWETTLETQSIPKNVTIVEEEKIEKDNSVNPPPSDNRFVDDEITETDIIESPLKTSYPELPFVSPPPPQTLLPYQEAVQILSEITDISTARAVFAIMFAEASKNPERTAFKSAGGFNYSGTQTDAGRWGNSEYITGRFARRDAVRVREFAIFESNRGFLEFMALRVKAKEIPGIDADKWTRKYIDKWWSPSNKAQLVQGTPKYENKKNIFLSADKRFDRFLA
jgi:hypothetical protein